MEKKLELITTLIDEKKGENIQVFDMKEKGYFVDNVIIATTLGDRHAAALLDALKTTLKSAKEHIIAVEESDDWIVMDIGDTLIHLMTPEYRSKYNIEEFLDNYEIEKLDTQG